MKCEDSMLPEGIETKVYGKVYDSSNDIPIVNLKLIIQELNQEPGFSLGPNIHNLGEIDSTYTDENGDYEINFETTGRGDTYRIFSPRNNQVWQYYQNPVHIENLGSSNEINFDFLKLHPIRLIIKVDNDLEFLPIRIRHLFTINRSLTDINSTSNDIIKLIYVPLNFTTKVEFYRTKPDGQNQLFIKEIQPITDVEPVDIEIDLKNLNFEDY